MEILSKIRNFTVVEVPSIKLVTFKDLDTYVYNPTGEYYTSKPIYLDKFYNSLGLKRYSFMKDLYSIDPSYAMKLLNSKLSGYKSPNLYLFESAGVSFWLSDNVVSNYNYVIDLINSRSHNIYGYESENYTSDSYYFYEDPGECGYNIYISLSREVVEVRRIGIQDGLFCIDMTTDLKYDLADPDFASQIRSDLTDSWKITRRISDKELSSMVVNRDTQDKLSQLTKVDGFDTCNNLYEVISNITKNLESIYDLDKLSFIYDNIY